MEWNDIIDKEAIFKNIITPLVLEASAKRVSVYPRGKDVFRAFDSVPFNDVKVCIIGQDPYHTPGIANGLAFSVSPDATVPPSLRNIFQELEKDLGLPLPTHGDLSSWAKQGVLLLNTVLTVEEGEPGSHYDKGWEEITGRVIHELSKREDSVVFILWGKKAKEAFRKYEYIGYDKTVVMLMASHPSPFSAHRGFFGCKHFSKINQWLGVMGKSPIDWRLDAL